MNPFLRRNVIVIAAFRYGYDAGSHSFFDCVDSERVRVCRFMSAYPTYLSTSKRGGLCLYRVRPKAHGRGDVS